MERVNWQLCHGSADVCELAFIIECPEVVELLKGPHECLWRGRIHVVEVDNVLYSKLLQGQHD